MLLRHKNGGLYDRLTEVLDRGDIRQFRRVIDVDRLARFEHHFENHTRCSGNQIQIVFALKTLLDDFHVQHAKEATTEAEAQCI